MEKDVDGKKLARLRVLKKAGIIGLAVSAAAIVIIAIFSFFPNGGGYFTIRFDEPSEAPNLVIAEDVDFQTEGTYFLGNPLRRTYETTLEDVYGKVSAFDSLKNVRGNQNIVNNAGYDEALVHTVYLKSTSGQEETYRATVNLDAYGYPTNNTSGPLDYMRILLYISEVNADGVSESNVNTRVYGRENIKNVLNEEGNLREAVSSYDTVMNQETGRNERKAIYALPNQQKYCEPFVSTNAGQQLVDREIVMQPQKVYRFTFVSYFEGFDPEGYGVAPSDSYVLLSLHFGK